ncbi:MAG: hypothetical protein NC338_07235 [Firmicutes bacterium]|nr:hypothetical protein [Bacillota bacterium]MCM1401788.1 hypothetical protein [Bacteroides sp.]MCM1477675.1 hypothetical protein [Bacteroides sp.]
MLNRIINLLCVLTILAGITTSCVDDLLYEDSVIGDGEAQLAITMDFHPLTAAINSPSRAAGTQGTPGDAISNIRSLTLFVYNEEGMLQDIITQSEMSDLTIKDRTDEGANTSMPNDAGGSAVQAEERTARATFTIKRYPFGKYYFYAVANIDGLEDNKETRDKFAMVNSLREFEAKWNEDDIAANDQMFGYVTYNDNDDKTSVGYDAPLLSIAQKHMELHSWLKRCASKVTVVYDGKGLHEGIYVYIKNVQIRDIPLYCKIGAPNSPQTNSADSMLNRGGMIEYNSAGILPEGETQGSMSTDWLEITKGGGLKGAVEVVDGDTITHSEYQPALYFYENMQGNYADASNKKYYDKRQQWSDVGYMPTEGEYDYKDNIKYGTYIEVEAYYISENSASISSGNIIYRYMLGQNDTYDYNATRNHHYKLTLGFKGYANQPDWHIEYIEPEETIYVDPTYHVSYSYNTKALFPIRFIGTPKSVSVEIVENNWAPYDSGNPDSVPRAEIPDLASDYPFKWNRAVYINEGKKNVTNALSYPGYNKIGTAGYYYGLQKPFNTSGTAQTEYTDPRAPKYVTPIWAGFLALQVPGNTPENIPSVLFPDDGYDTGYSKMYDYFYGKGNGNTLPQNYREFSASDFTFTGWQAGSTQTRTVGTGNNACEISKAADGSITMNLPMWTRPKTLYGISGFTGNNPYDCYQRKAVVKITVKFANSTVTKYMPVFQVRRMVNPKALWRNWRDNQNFHVTLLQREDPNAKEFSWYPSNGMWRAYIKTVSPGAEGFIYLTGGVGKDATGAVYGNTGTVVDFYINFAGTTKADQSNCAIIEVEYHGLTCKHSIFVRQGYKEPLQVGSGKAKWSSFCLYKVNGTPPAFGTQWDDSEAGYIPAELTVNPLSFGSFFKRGNYNAIMASNNVKYGVNVLLPRTATLLMGDGSYKTWENIEGYPISDSYGGWKFTAFPNGSPQKDFRWGRFSVDVSVGGATEHRHYKVPSYQDYLDLRNSCEYGIGVMYGDGSRNPAMTVDQAYGFEDFSNNGYDEGSSALDPELAMRGMRGFIIYDSKTANQIFFPLGARGAGRRTIAGSDLSATSYNYFGMQRYSNVMAPLDGAQNSLRPIPYNIEASPGAMFWMETCPGSVGAWDLNYFDLNFTSYSFPVGFTPDYGSRAFNITHGGDALPIKLVLDESHPH